MRLAQLPERSKACGAPPVVWPVAAFPFDAAWGPGTLGPGQPAGLVGALERWSGENFQCPLLFGGFLNQKSTNHPATFIQRRGSPNSTLNLSLSPSQHPRQGATQSVLSTTTIARPCFVQLILFTSIPHQHFLTSSRSSRCVRL